MQRVTARLSLQAPRAVLFAWAPTQTAQAHSFAFSPPLQVLEPFQPQLDRATRCRESPPSFALLAKNSFAANSLYLNMADPLSVAGLAAGVVSLGLQVSGGITTYIDALNCRDQDIASVRQQNECLQKILGICKTSRSQFERSHQDAAKAVGDHLDLCEKDLQALESLVTELTAGDQPTVRRRDRLRNTGKKLLYPYNRPKLEQLETKLHMQT